MTDFTTTQEMIDAVLALFTGQPALVAAISVILVVSLGPMLAKRMLRATRQ